MARELVLATRLEDDQVTKRRIALGIRHDYLLYQAYMNAENVSEWIRYLINRRLTEISKGVK